MSDKPREGRPPKLSEEVQTEIKRELSSRKQGWTTEQVTQLIAERGHVRYHFTHVYRLMHRWGFKEKVPQEEARQHRLPRGEGRFQKTNEELLSEPPRGFAIVCMDESFFIYDSLVRRVWIGENERPVVTVTGSHRHSVLYGALSLDGRQLFRQYDDFDGDAFFDYLKLIHGSSGGASSSSTRLLSTRQRRCSRTSRAQKTRWCRYGSLQPLPSSCLWKRRGTSPRTTSSSLRYYSSFEEFRKRIGEYFRTKRFHLDVANYLTAEPR